MCDSSVSTRVKDDGANRQEVNAHHTSIHPCMGTLAISKTYNEHTHTHTHTHHSQNEAGVDGGSVYAHYASKFNIGPKIKFKANTVTSYP